MRLSSLPSPKRSELRMQLRNPSTRSFTTRSCGTKMDSLWIARRTSTSGKRFPAMSRRCVLASSPSPFLELMHNRYAQNLLAIIARDRERLAALEAARIVFPEEREKIVQSEAPAKRRKSTNGARRECSGCSRRHACLFSNSAAAEGPDAKQAQVDFAAGKESIDRLLAVRPLPLLPFLPFADFERAGHPTPQHGGGERNSGRGRRCELDVA